MAEVLITLAIIGVVAVMTMPVLINKHEKVTSVTRLQKFYSAINQAVRLSEIDNGPVQEWTYPPNGNTYDQIKEFYDVYFAPYLRTVKEAHVIIGDRNKQGVYFADGSVMLMDMLAGIDVGFYTNEKYEKLCTNSGKSDRKHCFSFNLNKAGTVGDKSAVEPYSYTWDGTRENLINHSKYGCAVSGTFCAKLIQYDGWEIKDDYPW